MPVLAQDELHCYCSSSLLPIKGVQDKMQCSSLHQECLLLLRLIPFLRSGFQVTNILFNPTPPVPWSIKLGLRLTRVMDIVSQCPEINQEKCAYSWRLSCWGFTCAWSISGERHQGINPVPLPLAFLFKFLSNFFQCKKTSLSCWWMVRSEIVSQHNFPFPFLYSHREKTQFICLTLSLNLQVCVNFASLCECKGRRS